MSKQTFSDKHQKSYTNMKNSNTAMFTGKRETDLITCQIMNT